jgi:hypothetical protein
MTRGRLAKFPSSEALSRKPKDTTRPSSIEPPLCYTDFWRLNLSLGVGRMHQGKVANLFRKPGHRLPMDAIEEIRAVADKGLMDDASFGRGKRQVLLVDRKVLEQFQLKPGDVRENITIQDLDLASLPVGARLAIGSSLLEITSICEPCNRMDEIHPGLQQAISGKRGVLACVIRGGLIRVGDHVFGPQDEVDPLQSPL